MLPVKNEEDTVLLIKESAIKNFCANLEESLIFKMIYKPTLHRKDKEVELDRIFGHSFVKRNKNKCKLIYKNKKCELEEYLNEIDNNYINEINNKKNKYLRYKFKLINVENIADMSYIFHNCYSLLSLSIYSKMDNYKNNNELLDITLENNIDLPLFGQTGENSQILIDNIDQYSDIANNFYNEESPIPISSIRGNKNSNYNETNLSISNYFRNTSLNISKLCNMAFMFYGCNKISSLPDLSKLDTSNVRDMSHIFDDCYALNSLPDISKWNTSNVTDLSYMFYKCNALMTFPGI